MKTATRSMRNVQSWPFLSTQFPLPHRTNARLVSQIPKLSTLAYQTVKFEVIAHNPTTRTVPTHPKPTSRRYTTNPQTLRFSSHTSLFRTLPVQLSRFHHGRVPILLNQRPKDTPQILPFRTLQQRPSILHQASALFRTLPEQLSMFHHACVPANPS